MTEDQPPSTTVLVSNRQSGPVDEAALVRLARATLAGEGAAGAELSVSLVEPREMADLHLRYMGLPGPTDVLSFPIDQAGPADGGPHLLGDVVICPAYAAEHPTSADPAREMGLLLVHGILHLLGHDHEDENDRARMWALQERYSGVRVDPLGGSGEATA